MPAIEANVEAAWWAKQTAKGSPAAAADKRGRKVGGDMTVNREDGNEPYSDGERFNSATDFVNTLMGNGNPILQAQPGIIGHLAYLTLGQETVTAIGNLFEHVATPNNAGGFWVTFWKKVGQNIVQRQKFNDCRLVSLRVEGSSANKVVKVTPTFISLDAGEVFTTDPIKIEDVDEPFLYTEATGTFKIDGTVITSHSSFAFVISDGLAAWYGDDVVPNDITVSRGQITIEGVTLLVNQAGKDHYDRVVYGMPSPPAGTKPRKSVYTGSYEFDLKRGSNQRVALTGSPTGGTFTLTYDGQTTAGIAWNATAATVKAALEALSNVEVGDVEVTGGPGPGTAWDVVFKKTGATALTGVGTSLTPSGAVTVTDNGANRRAKVEFPLVKWNPDLAIPGNPGGGPVEIALGAETRKASGQPMVRISTRSADAAYT